MVLARARLLFALVLFASLTSGCASLGFGGAKALLDQAKDALSQQDYETAFQRFQELETGYPKSAESREAYPLAAGCFKVLYYRARAAQPDSVYVTTAPDFMFAWLETYFSDGTFPTDAVNTLFGGLPYNVFRDFQGFAKTQPSISVWDIRAEEDNGVIRTVTGTRG